VLVARNYQPSNLVRLLPEPARSSVLPGTLRSAAWRGQLTGRDEAWTVSRPEPRRDQIPHEVNAEVDQLLYLFACQLEWERQGDPSAAWEVISAARDPQNNIRAHARSLLERSQQIEPQIPEEVLPPEPETLKSVITEAGMKTPYNLEIIESCMGCKASKSGFFCRFSPSVLRSWDAVSHHTIMPPGAVLFVEGQTPRGIYVICSGTVKLSTSSKEGKVLILKQAHAARCWG
jgi:hypothetical protein